VISREFATKIKMKKLQNYLILLIAITLIGCTTTHSVAELNDELFFKESPKIVTDGNQYFLRFVYSDKEGAWGFAMYTSSEIYNDSLIFYIPVTTSSGNLRGRVQFEEIKSSEKIKIIKKEKVFWKEKNGTFIPLVIHRMTNEELKQAEN
jgi:hypothetical protein